MEHLNELSMVQKVNTKSFILAEYIRIRIHTKLKHRANMAEYIGENSYIIYKGEMLESTSMLYQNESDVEVTSIPEHILEGYYKFITMQSECDAWLRMWSNSADDPEDFKAGLPGINGDIQCDVTKKIHDELKQSPAYKEMEVRYLTHNLLKGN